MAGGGGVGSGLQVIGSGISTIGQIQAMSAQKKSLVAQSQALAEQAQFQKMVEARKLRLLENEQKQFAGRKQGMLSAAGVSLAGSALADFGNDLAEMHYERVFTKMEANYNIANLNRASLIAKNEAASVGRAMTLTAVGGILGMGGSMASMSSSSERPSRTTTTTERMLPARRTYGTNS